MCSGKGTTGMKKHGFAVFCCALALSACLLCAASAAGNTVPIDGKNFPDEAFREYVGRFDVNGDRKLDETELMNAEEMDCREASISSLEGIGFFAGLKSLDCSGNRLVSLDLRKNYQLQKINCSRNELTMLLLPGGPDLRSVECQENNMRYLSVNDSYFVMRPLVTETEREETEDGYARYSGATEDGSTASLILDPDVTVTCFHQNSMTTRKSVWAEEGNMGYWIYYTLNGDGTVTYEQYDGKYRYPDRKSYTIPDEIEGMAVTAIGDRAFSDCSNITEIKIPKTVTRIGTDAFARCMELKKINLPEKLEFIGDGAFAGCRSLKSITIPDSVTEIDGNPFIGWEDGAQRIKISAKHPVLEIRGGALINRQTQTMASYLGKKGADTYTVPDGVKVIGKNAFCCSELRSVTLPETVTAIGDCCFRECLALTSISLPEGLEQIGDCAFQNCTRLTDIFLPGSLKTVGVNPFVQAGTKNIGISPENSALRFYDDMLFATEDDRLISFTGDYDLEERSKPKKETVSREIPEGTRIIGDKAFYRISKVSGIILPESIEEIGAYAFSGMENLDRINIPASVRRIGGRAFSHTALSRVNIEAQIKTLPEEIFSGCDKLEEVTLPESLETIEDAAFFYCEALRTISIPDSVTEIGNSMFRHCISLKSIHLPAGLKKMSDGLLLECSALEELEIPSGVTEMEIFAVSECNGLKELILPDSMLRIGEYAVCRNQGLERVVLNDGLESIGDYAFGSNASLTEAAIPDHIRFINDSAFMGCEKLNNSFTEFLEELEQYGNVY